MGRSAPLSAAPAPEESEPAQELAPSAPRSGVQGRWKATSPDAELRELTFGAGGSLIVTLSDGSKLLGTYAVDGSKVSARYAITGSSVTRTYELVHSGSKTLLRPAGGGPFYARE